MLVETGLGQNRRVVVLFLLCESDLRSEAGGRNAHLDSGLAHALKGVTAGFGRWAFVDEIA